MASFEWPPSGGSGSGVTSLNSLVGDITLAAGTGISITPSGQTLTIASTSSGDVTIGAFGSTPNANGLSINGSQVLNMQPADSTHPGGISLAAQTMGDGIKTFNAQVLASNGSVSSPGYALTNSTNSGIYLSGTNKIGIAVNGALAIDTVKSSGGFGNVGLGAVASTSDSYPLLIQRSNVSTGTYAQISNPDTSASSKATWQLSTDSGANNGEVSLFTAATATDAYAGRMTIRPSDSTVGLSLIGGDLSTGDVRVYVAGDYTSAGRNIQFNADKTSQLMQSVTAPTSPASGLKFYNNAGLFSSKTTGGVVSSFAGINTGDQTITLTGDVTGSGTGSFATTVAKIQSTVVSGTTGSTNVVFSSAPTLSNPVVGTQSQNDNSTKAASTAYVDLAITNALAGVNPAVTVQAATTAAGDTSGFTYNNGASGVGAFFTGSVNTAVTIDGYTFTALGQRLLVKNDTQSPSGAFNGVYYVTQVQTAILAPILTRALDFNTPSDMNNTGAIPVENGTVNAITQWVLTTLVTTVGTSPLTFTKFARNPADYLLVASNLSDVASKSTSFNNLSPMTTGGDLIYGGSSGAGTRLANGSAGQFLQSAGGTSAPVWYTPTTTNWVAYTPTFTGFGTVSSVAIWSRRVGSNLEVRGTFTSGTSTAVEARMNMGFNGTDGNVTSTDSTYLPATSNAGAFTYNQNGAASQIVLMEQSKTYITFALQTASSTGMTKQLGNALTASGWVVVLQASIPISGWSV